VREEFYFCVSMSSLLQKRKLLAFMCECNNNNKWVNNVSTQTHTRTSIRQRSLPPQIRTCEKNLINTFSIKIYGPITHLR
jgi:hypothetical protein